VRKIPKTVAKRTWEMSILNGFGTSIPRGESWRPPSRPKERTPIVLEVSERVIVAKRVEKRQSRNYLLFPREPIIAIW
jgi:hypothetical protein